MYFINGASGDRGEVGYDCLCFPEKWLEPERTLGEQGVTETMEITLKRKLFFSDGRVDITDLVRLNVIYVQVI